MWFTENGRNAIGRISTNGTVTELTTGFSNPPFGIVAGPDGNLWFTEGNWLTFVVGRRTTGGSVTEVGGLTYGWEGGSSSARTPTCGLPKKIGPSRK